MCLRDGMKERSISHQRTSTRGTQIDILETICIPRRNVALLLGKFPYLRARKQELMLYESFIRHLVFFRCDRILWFGEGLHQLSYVRGESRFSDHRPVYGIFCAEVESAHNRLKRTTSYSASRVQAEELLPYSRGYTELSFF